MKSLMDFNANMRAGSAWSSNDQNPESQSKENSSILSSMWKFQSLKDVMGVLQLWQWV